MQQCTRQPYTRVRVHMSRSFCRPELFKQPPRELSKEMQTSGSYLRFGFSCTASTENQQSRVSTQKWNDHVRGNPISQFSSVQSLSRVQLFATLRTEAHQASLSITNSRNLLNLMSFESVMPSNHLILCHPLLLLPSIFPSTTVFSSGSILHIRWPEYWSFSFSISHSKEYSGLIFRIDGFDLLAVQGTLKSLLQHHSSKASILRCSAFFIVQLLDPYVTTGKTIALTRWTFVGKVMSLLFNILLGWSQKTSQADHMDHSLV